MASPTTLALFSWAGTTMASVGSATANITQTPIDITDLGSTYKKHSYGLLEGTVSLEVFYNVTDHATITTALSAKTENTALVQWATGVTFSGNAMVESLSLTVAPNGVATANIELRFTNGAISFDVTP
jgi:Phage tail tube protein